MGWQLKSVEFRDLFRYYGDHAIEFSDDQSSYLVLGLNKDESGVDSNGSGKSSFFDIITWCLFGKTPRSELFGTIVSRGKDRSWARVTFSDGDDVVWIERSRNKKGDSVLRFFRNDEDLSRRTNTLTQKEIYRFFGYDDKRGWQDYLSQVYFSSASSKGFLASDVSPADRQAVLERFLGLRIFDEARDLVKVDHKELNSQLVLIKNELDSFDLSMGQYEPVDVLKDKLKELCEGIGLFVFAKDVLEKKIDAVEKLSAEFVRKVDDVKELKTFLEVLDAQKIRLAERYAALLGRNQEALSVRKEWTNLLEAEFLSLSETLLKLSTEQNQIVDEFNVLEKDRDVIILRHNAFIANLDSTQKQLEDVKACPKCGTKLMISFGDIIAFDGEELTAVLAELSLGLKKEVEKLGIAQTACDLCKEEVEVIKDSIDEHTVRHVELKKVQTFLANYDFSAIDNLVSESKSVEVEYNSILKKLEVAEAFCKELRDKWVDFVESLEMKPQGVEWGNSDLAHILSQLNADLSKVFTELEVLGIKKSQIDTGIEKVKELELGKVESQKRFNLLKKEETELSYWVGAFPKIKNVILSSFVPVFENAVNRFLSDLQIKERVRFSLSSETKAGTIKVGFSIQVFDGFFWADFDSYSGGEKSRILVSVGFALRELALRKTGESGFGFLLCDELVDNMDSTGMEYFFVLLKKVGGQKFVITHTRVDEAIMECDHRLLVTRENGISKCEVV